MPSHQEASKNRQSSRRKDPPAWTHKNSGLSSMQAASDIYIGHTCRERQQVSVACGQPLQLRKKTGSMFISLALTQYMAGMSCQISMPRRSAWW